VPLTTRKSPTFAFIARSLPQPGETRRLLHRARIRIHRARDSNSAEADLTR